MAFDPFSDFSMPRLRWALDETGAVVRCLYERVAELKRMSPESEYWSEGVGGAALEAGRQAIHRSLLCSTTDRAQMVRQAQRAYFAIVRLMSVIQMARYEKPLWAEPEHAKGERFMARVERACGRDKLNTFFRYAADLLFEMGRHPMLGWNWMACSISDHMMANPLLYEGQDCSVPGCHGTLRRMTWDDVLTDGTFGIEPSALSVETPS